MLSRRVLRSFKVGARHNSTTAPEKLTRRTILLEKLGNIDIPSAAEINAKKAAAKPSAYEADISYLKDAPDHYLSAKLMQMDRPPAASEEKVAELTEQRRQNRLARQTVDIENLFSRYGSITEKNSIIRSEMEKSSAFLSPERTNIAIQSATRRRAQRAQLTSRPRPQDEAQVDGQPRRLESDRPRRPRPSQDGPHAQGRKPSQARQSKPGQARKPPPKPSQTVPTIQVADVDLSIFEGAYKPTFIGAAPTHSDPRSLFGSVFSAKDATVVAESGQRFVVPTSRVDSFHKSGYDAYIKAAPEDFGALPDEIGPLKVAQRTLSHQGHYSLPAKVGTVALIARVTPKTPTPTHANAS